MKIEVTYGFGNFGGHDALDFTVSVVDICANNVLDIEPVTKAALENIEFQINSGDVEILLDDAKMT